MASTLWGDAEGALCLDEAVGHARCVKGSGWAAIAVKKDQAASGVGAMGEFADAGVGNELRVILRRRGVPQFRARCAARAGRRAQQVGGHFRHHDFHDAFAVAGAGDAAGLCVGVAAAADER